MQDLIRRIIKLEEEYYSVFSAREEDGPLIRFSDEEIQDMYTHNFTWVTQEMQPEELREFIASEKARRRAQGKDFLMLRFQYRIDEALLPADQKDRFTDLEYYRLNQQAVKAMKDRSDLEIIRLSDILADEARELDELSASEATLDFSRRRFDRRLSVYLSDEGPDNYLALLEWEAVGSLDYFARDGACMLEDFVVDPEYRGQGIGTALLKTMAQAAFDQGNDLVYLTADKKETAREMYGKLGFEKVFETSEVLYKF